MEIVDLLRLVTDEQAPTSSRVKAAWLLKDLSDPRVAPNLERVACTNTCPEQLREQILDTLERMSFGAPELSLDLDRLSEVSRGPGERRALFGILLNLGSERARTLLGASLDLPEDRSEILSLLATAPATWIDPFLESAPARADPDGQIGATLAARRRRRSQAELKSLPKGVQVGPDVVRDLWTGGDLSLLAWLASHEHLDDAATDEVLKLEAPADMPKSQRRLLSQAQQHLRASTG